MDCICKYVPSLIQKFFLIGAYHTQNLTNAEISKKRVHLFNEEKQRQSALITDIKKIVVKYKGEEPEPSYTLIMNKNISTPLDCSKR